MAHDYTVLTIRTKDIFAREEQELFWRTFFYTLGSGGAVKPTFNLIRYPKDARNHDLARIGQDMYRSMGKFDRLGVHEES